MNRNNAHILMGRIWDAADWRKREQMLTGLSQHAPLTSETQNWPDNWSECGWSSLSVKLRGLLVNQSAATL